MNLTRLKYLSITLIALSTQISTIICGRGKEKSNPNETARVRDIAQAMSLLYEELPAHMTVEEKCKRYAVLSSEALSEKTPKRKTISRVLSMTEDELNRDYHQLDTNRMTYAFMSAIDKFRVTQLAPAFLDLIECLRLLDAPAVKTYLDNEELFVIYDLYRQVLGLQGTVDLGTLDVTRFNKAFWTPLRKLFKPHFDIDSVFTRLFFNRMGPPNVAAPSSPKVSDAQPTDDRQMRRQQFLARDRERTRLAKQRIKVHDPEAIRRYQERMRKLAREREQIAWSYLLGAPEEGMAQELAIEKRNRVNERRRRRRQALREQKQYQRLLKSTSANMSHEDPAPSLLRKQEQVHTDSQMPATQVTQDLGQQSFMNGSLDPDCIIDHMTLDELKHIDESLSLMQSFDPESPKQLQPNRDNSSQDDDTDEIMNLLLSQLEEQPGPESPQKSADPNPDVDGGGDGR